MESLRKSWVKLGRGYFTTPRRGLRLSFLQPTLKGENQMAVYSISYDLNSPGQKHQLISNILTTAGAIKVMETYWLLDTVHQSAVEIREALQTVVDSNDVLFIARINLDDCATWGIKGEPLHWINLLYRNW
ncbi:hypothetical protein [Vibrio algivorus]|uniref:Uncharacterized protein n=1 Tax=Vibrio algivorus TaxID=1667024 RepID=A0A557P9Q0_9VIBR|nr:hypothetical protein [Vibrio algivorus]TVO37377.1 hypothetical protein FOF44_07145 [Vibrio algivorus]